MHYPTYWVYSFVKGGLVYFQSVSTLQGAPSPCTPPGLFPILSTLPHACIPRAFFTLHSSLAPPMQEVEREEWEKAGPELPGLKVCPGVATCLCWRPPRPSRTAPLGAARPPPDWRRCPSPSLQASTKALLLCSLFRVPRHPLSFVAYLHHALLLNYSPVNPVLSPLWQIPPCVFGKDPKQWEDTLPFTQTYRIFFNLIYNPGTVPLITQRRERS